MADSLYHDIEVDSAFDAFGLAARNYGRALETLHAGDPALADAKALLAATRATWEALAPRTFMPSPASILDSYGSNVVSLAGRRA
jgi:hypothetical protein